MARASGCLVMTGNKDGEFSMNVEFAVDGASMPPHPLRIGGYYVGNSTSAEMIADLSRRASAGMDDSKPDVTGSVGNVGTGSEFNEVRTVESQSSTGSLKPASPGLSLMDTAKEADSDSPKQEDTGKEADSPEENSPKQEDTSKQGDRSKEEDTAKVEDATKQEDSVRAEASGKEVSGRSQSVVGLQPHLGPFAEKPVRAMGRAPIGPLRRDHSSVDDVETEVQDVDDYYVVGEDVRKPVSLCLVPLELEDQKTIGGSDSTTKFSLRGKSNGTDIMRPISAWKLVFLESLSFQILVKIAQKSDTKWVKLGKPCSRFKETADGVFTVAKVLALLKKEPKANEDRVRNLLEGDVAPETFRDHLRMQYPLMEQFINLDPVLKDSGAQKTLLSFFDREKEANSGKRALSDRDSSDGVDNRPVKKSRAGNVVQRTEKATRVDTTSHAALEDVNMGESESEEEYYDESESESDDEFGDSFCIFCDDGGILLCCDGPCMRSFHATIAHGLHSGCKSLGFSEAAVAKMVGKWLCKNCNYKQHQCYVCGELGASTSDEGLGVRQEVFVCNVACCGKFYHPKCIASKLTAAPSERGALAENIQAGKESFTCTLHTCKACGGGEDREVVDLILVKCRRCPTAWHRKCLPRSISFEEDAQKRNLEIRAWKFGVKHPQFICYCTDHKIIGDLGTPLRNHVKFALTPAEAKEFEEFEKQKKRVDAVTTEPVRYGAKTTFAAASMGKSAGKKYPSADLSAKARPDSLIGSSSLPPPRPNISKDAVKRSEDAGERIVDSIIARSKLKVTEESVKTKHETNLPGIYKPKKSGNKDFMKMGMIDSILEAAKAAMEKILHARGNDALMICDRQTLLKLLHEEERLRTYLAPTLFGKRYTSYGRHFTKVKKLEKVVEILQPYIWEKDMIVDFSCGDNSFCRLLRKSLSEAGKTNCQFKNFDLFPSKDSFGFEQKDWFEVGMKDCGPGENLVIGLNPPFAFVEKFVSHALDMNPRLLVLIVPPMRKNLEHLGYECLVDDDSLMAEKSFYLPGSVNEKNTKLLEQGNNVAPHFFIYCSKKFSGRYKGGPGVNVPEQCESGPSTAANLNPSSAATIWKGESKPATKPAPKSEPTANLFIPSAQQQPQPGRAPNEKTKAVKLKSAPRNRDPRQALQVARNSTGVAMARLPDLDAQQEEGEISSSSQGHAPFRNNMLVRPIWRLNDQLPGPPPGPPPAHVQQAHMLNPRHFSRPVFLPRPFIQGQPHYRPRPDEYSPFEPGLFPPGSGGHHMPMGHHLPPYRPVQHNGFYQGPRPGPSPRHEPPVDDGEGFGGWIDG